MNIENAEKLIKLYKQGYQIQYLADTDDYYGWVPACGSGQGTTMTFDIVDFYVDLCDDEIKIESFKVSKECIDWWEQL